MDGLSLSQIDQRHADSQFVCETELDDEVYAHSIIWGTSVLNFLN